MDDDILKLENQLCFPLYVASKEVVAKYKPFLQEIDLTYTQYITMMVLWEEKTISVNELGKKLYLDSGTITPLLKRLELKRYITRERSIEDERIVLVSITDLGESLKKTALKIPSSMASCITLSIEESKTLYYLLKKLI